MGILTPDEIAGLDDNETIFEYDGICYNRPLGRGLVLEDIDSHLNELLDILPEGYHQIKIIVT